MQYRSMNRKPEEASPNREKAATNFILMKIILYKSMLPVSNRTKTAEVYETLGNIHLFVYFSWKNSK